MRFAYLDGIRGIAALFVLARHWNPLLGFDFHFSYLAVDIFFLLSGFVIAHAYDEKLRRGELGIGAFMSIRLARLYPVYALAVAVSLVGELWLPTIPGEPAQTQLAMSAGLALLFLPSAVAGSTYLFPLNLCFWSLFAELILNGLYAATRRFLSDTVLLVIIAAMALMLVVIAAKTGRIDHGYRFTITSAGAGLVRATFGMALGLFMYRRRALLAALGSRVSPWIGILLVVAVMMAPAVQGMSVAVELAALFIVFPAAIAIASATEPADGWPLRAMVLLAISSYPIYLLHIPVGKVLSHLVAGTPALSLPVALAAAVALFVLSLQIERHFDIPARRWLRACFTRRSVAAGG